MRPIIFTAEERGPEAAKRQATGMKCVEQDTDKAAERRLEAYKMRSAEADVDEIENALGITQRTVYLLFKN